MDSSDKFLCWMFLGGLALLFSSIIIRDHLNKSHIENMAKEGYIQKVEGHEKIWVKP